MDNHNKNDNSIDFLVVNEIVDFVSSLRTVVGIEDNDK